MSSLLQGPDLIDLAALLRNLPVRSKLVQMKLNPSLHPTGLFGRKTILSLSKDFTRNDIERCLMAVIPNMNVRLRMLTSSLADHADDYPKEH